MFSVIERAFDFTERNEPQGMFLGASEKPTGVSDCLVIHFRSSLSNPYHRAILLFDTSSADSYKLYYRKFRSSWGDWKTVSTT